MDIEQIIQELKDGFAKVNENEKRQFTEIDKKMIDMQNRIKELEDRIEILTDKK